MWTEQRQELLLEHFKNSSDQKLQRLKQKNHNRETEKKRKTETQRRGDYCQESHRGDSHDLKILKRY